MQSRRPLHSPWFILFIVLLASIAAPLNQFKVPPVLPLLMDAFQQTASRAGLLMSVFAITGIILAIPAGFIFQRWGYRITGLAAIFPLILGAALGALSNGMEIMLISRLIEGAGMSLMSVVAPAVIAVWFTADKRGKAMGIWAIWVPLGSTVMFIFAPLLERHWGWQGIWWVGCFYTIVVGLFYYLFIRENPGQIAHRGNQPQPEGLTGRELNGVLLNRNLWLISFLFGCFNFVFIAFITWAPTFLHQTRGTSLAEASLLVSFVSILAMVACPTSGWISDKIGSRKVVSVIPMILMAFLFPLSLRESFFFPLVIALGFIGGFVPTGVFSAGVEVVGDERLGGMAMAVIQIGQNAGMLLGPLIFGWVVEAGGGWPVAFWILVPVSAAGALAGWVAKMR